MKRIVVSLTIIISSLIFIDKIYAGFACDNPTTLVETSMASPAYLEANLPVCTSYGPDPDGYVAINSETKKYKDAFNAGLPEGVAPDFSDPSFVAAIGDMKEKYEAYTMDDKSIVTKSRTICSDAKAKLQVSLIFNYWTRYSANKRDLYKACVDGCSEDDNECLSDCDDYEGKYSYYCNDKADQLYSNGGKHYYCLVTHIYEYKEDLPLDSNGISSASKDAAWEKCETLGFDEWCRLLSTSYTFLCPVYSCRNEGKKTFNICTPSFQEKNGSNGGDTVYCVNPSQLFSTTFSTTAKYQVDTSFNVKDCASSYSTVDCGYANIVIEGQKLKFSDKISSSEKKSMDKVIEFALRLWGVHTSQAGFDRLGISHKAGEKCNESLFYTKIKNIYKETYKYYFTGTIFENVRLNGEIDPNILKNYFFVGCASDKLGVACGDTNEYKLGLALLANTILGNDKMQEDFNNLFRTGVSEDVDSVYLVTEKVGDKEHQYIEITFEEISEITKEINKKIDCTQLDEMVKNKIITVEQKNQIKPFCSVKAVLVDSDGNVLQKYIKGKSLPAYCYKNFCRIEIDESFAICDYEKKYNKKVKVRLSYNKSDTSNVIKKYISCSNPNKSQVMFSISDGRSGTNLLETPVIEEFELTNIKCHGTCENYDLRKNIIEKCSDDTNNYNKTFDSSIKDPSLKCIINMVDNSIQNSYNYNSVFEINNNFCKVYCSDELVYHVADKTKSISGRKFYYDIEESLRSEKNIRYLFSNIIEEKRSCVSEIYYNNEFTDHIDWKSKYGLGSDIRGESDGITDEEINGINNWISLFKVLLKKSEFEGGRTENLNKILYDLYNCNLYTDKEIRDLGIIKPNGYQSLNIKESIIKMFSEDNNYGIKTDDSCIINSNTNTCITMNNIEYSFGPNPDGKSVSMKSVQKFDNSKIDNIIYCKAEDNCFTYDPDHPENEYNYPTSGTSSLKPLKNVVGKDIVRDNIVANVLASEDLKVPINDYAMFTVALEVDFYNNSRFEVLPNGNAIKAGTANNDEEHLILEAFAYPINYLAYNLEVCKTKDFLDGYNRCLITQKYDKIATFFRKNLIDEFYNVVNNSNKYECYVDVTPPFPSTTGEKSSLLYRNVDPSALFPNSEDGYTKRKNSNWATEFGHKVTDMIESSSDKLTITDDYLEYRITLNPVQINSIKEYNKQHDSYVNEDEISCVIKDDTYQNCLSPFLEELRNSNRYGNLDKFYRIGGEVKERIDKQ